MQTDPVSRQATTVTTTAALIAQSSTLSTPSDLLPPLRNPPLLEATEDLTNLSYLNEPSGQSRHPFSPLETIY